jgi:hypothetical protein
MGAVQVLRVAVAGALAIALAAGPARAAPVVVVVDPRPATTPADAAALRDAIAAAALAPIDGARAQDWAGRGDDDLALDAALARQDGSGRSTAAARRGPRTQRWRGGAPAAAAVDERARASRVDLPAPVRRSRRRIGRGTHAADRVRALGGSPAVRRRLGPLPRGSTRRSIATS